ncbi:MAG: hypothetical protein WBI60_06905 [Defluviitoga tunisiensis]
MFSATVIKFNNLLKTYNEIYTSVPFFRFVNSTEGLGLDYLKEFYKLILDVEEDSIQRFLNSSVVFYPKKDYSINDILNPNYFNLLYKLTIDAEKIAIYSTEYEVFDQIFTKVFGATKLTDVLYKLEDKSYRVIKNDSGIFLNMEPDIVDIDEKYLLTGSTKNIYNKNEDWDFYVSVEDRTLVITFESNNYGNSKKFFNLSQLENKVIFGEAIEMELIDKSSFVSYFNKFMLPLDKETEESLHFINEIIEKEEFVVVNSRGITNEELCLFFEAPLDKEKIDKFALERNLPKGEIGSYYFYQFSSEISGDVVYLYISEDDFIFSNVEPKKVNTYFSQLPRLKNTSYYKIVEEKEKLFNFFVLNLTQYLSNNFYASLDSFIVREEFPINNNYIIKIKAR